MLNVLLGITLIVLLVDLSLIILWLVNYKDEAKGITDTPFVSVLVAARNEEENLGDCLESLLAIDYPADKFEILIGNDNSNDKTGDLANAYAIRHEQIKSFTIVKQKIKGNGKANVLAQLVDKANGEFLFITDADIRVPENWFRAMLAGMEEDIALVTGTSVVVGKSILAYLQQIDWLFATGMLKVVSDLGIPVTTMGNNMLIRRKVYNEIGGFETLPFSVTEDLELFNRIKKNYKTVNLFNAQVLNQSTPIKSLPELLQQRKRWMRGAFDLPIVMVGLLVLQASFFVIVLGLLFFIPWLALAVIGIKYVLRYCFLSLVVHKLKDRINIFGSLFFELYMAIFSVVSLFYYFTSRDIDWKGRKY